MQKCSGMTEKTEVGDIWLRNKVHFWTCSMLQFLTTQLFNSLTSPTISCTQLFGKYFWLTRTDHQNAFTHTINWQWKLIGGAHWWVILTLSPLVNTGSVRKSESILSTAAPCRKQKTLAELAWIKNTEARAFCSAKRMWGKIHMVNNLWAKYLTRTCLHTVEVMLSKWQPENGYVTTCIHKISSFSWKATITSQTCKSSMHSFPG